MIKEQSISREYFIKRFTELCLRSGLAGLPKDELDQQILFKSAGLGFGKAGQLSELEVNEKLDYWVSRISQLKGLDYITLRRSLVDNGYLTRSKDGSSYQAGPGPKGLSFEASIDEVDLEAALEEKRQEIARRKQEYLEKANQEKKSKSS